MLKKIMLTSLISLSTLSASAETYLTRNSNLYELGGGSGKHALAIVTTIPAQPNQPIYSWRTHTKRDGTPGALSQNASFVGYTDSRGIFIAEGMLPTKEIYCGKYTNERVAVGSPYAPKSNSVNFVIKFADLAFGPLPHWRHNC